MEEKDNDKIVNGTHSVDNHEPPKILDKEKDDAPAARNIRTTLIIAVVVLLIIYVIYELMSK